MQLKYILIIIDIDAIYVKIMTNYTSYKNCNN